METGAGASKISSYPRRIRMALAPAEEDWEWFASRAILGPEAEAGERRGISPTCSIWAIQVAAFWWASTMGETPIPKSRETTIDDGLSGYCHAAGTGDGL